MTDLDGMSGPGLEEYADRADRRRRTHPVSLEPLRELLERRPELAGMGVSYVLEAVTA